MKWLKLELLPGVSPESTLSVVQRHIERYSYVLQQGFTLEFYQNPFDSDDAPQFIVRTNHPGFFESCKRLYGNLFRLYKPSRSFALPENFIRILTNLGSNSR